MPPRRAAVPKREMKSPPLHNAAGTPRVVQKTHGEVERQECVSSPLRKAWIALGGDKELVDYAVVWMPTRSRRTQESAWKDFVRFAGRTSSSTAAFLQPTRSLGTRQAPVHHALLRRKQRKRHIRRLLSALPANYIQLPHKLRISHCSYLHLITS